MSNNSLNKTQHTSGVVEKIDNNVVGETRHYPAASKEWSNSIYAYNKNTVKSLPAKDKVANSLLKSYFNFVAVSQNNTKSRRMRNLIRRNSTKKLFVSKPEIKQTNDKVIITAYTADREKDFLLRKLYFFNKSYKNGAVGVQSPTRYISALKNLFHGASLQETSKLIVSTTKKDKTFVENVLPAMKSFSTQSKTSRDMMVKKLGRFSRLHIRNKAKNSGISLFRRKLSKRLKTYTIRKNLFKNRLAISIIKKKNFLKNVFFYSFLKWTLSIFKINIYIHQTLKGGVKAKKLIVINKGDYYKVLTIDNNANYSVNFRKINIILFQLLMLTLTRKGFQPSGKPFVNGKSEQVSPAAMKSFSLDKLVFFLFRYFKFKYYGKFVQKHLKKEVLALNYLYMLSLNNFKFDRFLPGLKHLISRIYSKKVELNLVNLKYLHLNSDIFSESIAIKLRKKKNSLLRVLRGSLKLVKIPSKQSSASLEQRDLVKQNALFTESLSNFRPLDNYMALHNDDDFIAANKVVPNYNETRGILYPAAVSDVLHVVLKKMFPNNNLAAAKSEASTQFVKHNESVLLDTSANVNGALNKESVTRSGGVSKKMSEILLNSIKYKWITGARIEAKGRLTKRFTASRSLFKFRYKGSLRNVDYSGLNAPSVRGITRKAPSTVMVRGQMKPNLQYTFVSSKKRIGAFGIKGWISSN